MSVARFDFSWGDAEYHQETLDNLKVAVKSTKKLCAVMFFTFRSFDFDVFFFFLHFHECENLCLCSSGYA